MIRCQHERGMNRRSFLCGLVGLGTLAMGGVFNVGHASAARRGYPGPALQNGTGIEVQIVASQNPGSFEYRIEQGLAPARYLAIRNRTNFALNIQVIPPDDKEVQQQLVA